MVQRSQAKSDRQARVKELHHSGLDRDAIANQLGITVHTVRNDLSELGLVARTRNLDRTEAYRLADSGMSWPDAAKQCGISYRQYWKWMKESGRNPPPKKTSKHHLKPKAFAMYDAGETWQTICDELDIATCTLSQWLRSRGRTQPTQLAAILEIEQ
jgi:DNA invertase Pin-like site-specific DNA recombinase